MSPFMPLGFRSLSSFFPVESVLLDERLSSVCSTPYTGPASSGLLHKLNQVYFIPLHALQDVIKIGSSELTACSWSSLRSASRRCGWTTRRQRECLWIEASLSLPKCHSYDSVCLPEGAGWRNFSWKVLVSQSLALHDRGLRVPRHVSLSSRSSRCSLIRSPSPHPETRIPAAYSRNTDQANDLLRVWIDPARGS